MCMQTRSDKSLQCNSSSPPPQKQARTQKRRVHFAETVTEMKADGSHQLSETQVTALWFTSEQYSAIRGSIKRCIRYSEEAKRRGTFRGLEFLSDEQRQTDVENNILDILDVQDYNLKVGADPSQWLPALATALSKSHVSQAVQEAAMDAKEANQIYKEMMDASAVHNKCLQ